MPELPEVETLVRHLEPLLCGQVIRRVEVRRPKVVRPTTPEALTQALVGARFHGVRRRGKYLLFELRQRRNRAGFELLGHLGMTGRMYLLPPEAPLPRHAAVVLDLNRHRFVYEDTRYFGRLTLDLSAIDRLGPEPLTPAFSTAYLRRELQRSRQPIKIKLLDQALVAGVGNIYASEALFRARVSPRRPANRLDDGAVRRLCRAVRAVLATAIRFGSTVPLNWEGARRQDRLFYYGAAAGTAGYREEKLRVYDRAGQPCGRCGSTIRRMVQASRSTFYCPRCQR